MYKICIKMHKEWNVPVHMSQKYYKTQESLSYMAKGTGCVFADHVRECEIINNKDDHNQYHKQRHRVLAIKDIPLILQSTIQPTTTGGPTQLKPTELDHSKDFQKDIPTTMQLDSTLLIPQLTYLVLLVIQLKMDRAHHLLALSYLRV